MRNSASPTCRAAGTTRHDCPGQERVAYLSARFLESRNAAASCAAWSGRRPSKRNLVVHFAALAGAGHGRLLLACRGAGGTEIGAIIRAGLAAALAGPVEHGELGVEVLQHHFGRVLVLAGLVLPFAGLQLALEIDLRALLQILLGDPAKPLAENHHAVPLGPLAALAGGLVAPALRGGDAQIRDRAAVLGAPDLGILAQIADQDHLVDRTCHDLLLLNRPNALVTRTLGTSGNPSRHCHRRHPAFPQVGAAGRMAGPCSLLVLAC